MVAEPTNISPQMMAKTRATLQGDILNGKIGGLDTLKVLIAFRVFFCLVFVYLKCVLSI